ncbi:MAG TPA: multidrug effflux MFS transporter, partial [Bacteroidota bacterium]|nr:multidrug effflux MFS transporter [Bacteroidota bacterium]
KIIFILGALSAFGPFSIDMYLPGFPAVARDLGTDIEHVALSLSSYFVGISLGQLIYGPLVDRFGRKKPLLVGLVLYGLSAVGCASAGSIGWLIALRLFQALGACAGLVASRAVVRDLFPVTEIAKVFSALMLVMGVAPIIAPSIGGAITAAFGWRSIFIFLVGFTAVMTVAVAYLFPESKEADPTVSFHPWAMLREYAAIARDHEFITYGVAGGLSSAGLFAYISAASFVFMDLFGFTPLVFGQFFALNAAGLITGSQLNTLLLRKRTGPQILRMVSTVLFLSTVALVGSNLLWGATPLGTIAPLFLYLFMHGFMNPNTAALALAPFTRNAGSASALLGAGQMLLSAAVSALVSALHNGTAMPMAGMMLLCAGGSWMLIMTHERRIATSIR